MGSKFIRLSLKYHQLRSQVELSDAFFSCAGRFLSSMDSNSNQHSSPVEYSRRPKSTHLESHKKHAQGGSKDHNAELPVQSRPVRPITSPKKPTSSAFAPKPINAVSSEDIQAEALPVPIPDVGLSSANHAPTTLVVHPGLMPVTKPTSGVLSESSPVATFMMEPGSSATDSYAPFPSFPPHKEVVNTSGNHLLVIIFASLGGAFVLVLVFVLFRIRSRPRRRYHPTPSLPILQDAFPDRPAAEDSPIFGGKERFSSTLGNDEKWTWTQYHSKPPEKDWQNRTNERNVFADPEDNGSYLHPSNDGLLSAQPSSRKRPNFLSRSLSRVSTLSAYSTSKSDVVGLLANNTPRSSSLTADPFVDRAKTRTSYQRSKDKNTLRITVKDWDAEDPEQYIYGGAEVMPVIVEPPPATHTTGRQRIKAPYQVGSCPSLNSIAPSISSPSIVSDPFEDTPFIGASYVKSEARRERDTKALTAALGLPLSSSDGHSHHAGATDGRKNIPGSPIDPGMRLGNMMISDYPETSSSTKPLRIPRDSLGGPQTQRIRLVDDKPPRVPSPPPMPSLVQMAMAHNNGLDYDTYRSPTYSLYDMYANTRSVYGGNLDQV
jgi:hypothetical protein